MIQRRTITLRLGQLVEIVEGRKAGGLLPNFDLGEGPANGTPSGGKLERGCVRGQTDDI